MDEAAVWCLGFFLDRSAGPIGGISERNTKVTQIEFYFKFLITANVF